MITDLKIDGISYLDQVVSDATFKLHIVFENGLNNPSSSELTVTFINSLSLQNLFNSSIYGIYQSGYVELFEDFGSCVWQGYIDKQGAPDDWTTETIEFKILGIEKKHSQVLTGFTVQQIYYELSEDIPVGQIGGRQDATLRLDAIEEYNRIDSLVNIMFNDIGFSDENIVTNYKHMDSLKYKYNSDKYGLLVPNQPHAGFISISGDEVAGTSIIPPLFDRRIKKNYSYNELLKEFAKLTGCVYFFDYLSGKALFINRDYDFTSDLNKSVIDISEHIIDDKPSTFYKYSYDGLELTFDDIRLSTNKEINSGIIPGVGFKKYTIEASGSTIETVTTGGHIWHGVTLENGTRYLLSTDTETAKRIVQYLMINNGIGIDLNANLSDYLPPSIGYDTSAETVFDFLQTYVYENYEYVLGISKENDLLLKGNWFAPMRVKHNNQQYNVFETETDLIKEETRIKFEQ